METIKPTTQIDSSGTLRLELPTYLANQDVEVLVVLNSTGKRTAVGWPVDYFEAIDAIEADDVVERPN